MTGGRSRKTKGKKIHLRGTTVTAPSRNFQEHTHGMGEMQWRGRSKIEATEATRIERKRASNRLNTKIPKLRENLAEQSPAS
jgi:hypothetical protein